MDPPLDLHDLLLLESHQQHLLFRAGVTTLTLQKRDTPVQVLQQHVRHGLPPVGDDIGHLGGIQAIEHGIHHPGSHEQPYCTVQRCLHAAEHHCRQRQHYKIWNQHQLPHGEPGHPQLQEPGHHIRAAGGGTLGEHDPQAQAHQCAAAQRCQHGIHGGKMVCRSDGVNGHRTDEHGKEGGSQQMKADVFPAREKQRNIQHKG